MEKSLAIVNQAISEVSTQVRGYLSHGTLQLPAGYSAENALKAAALMLPSVKNKQKIPVLQACSPESIKSALLSMCVQGLNPDKNQCYFIPYGSHLLLKRSYFGDIDVAKRVDPNIEDIFAAVVFEGDKFEYTIKRGKIVNINHTQKLENKDKSILAAYATVCYRDGQEISTVMTRKQLLRSWAQSPTHPVEAGGKLNPESVHGRFPEEMAKRTVIHRACKPIINNSDDQSLFAQEARKTNDDAFREEADENANRVYIETKEAPTAVNPETGEVLEPEKPQEPKKEEVEPF